MLFFAFPVQNTLQLSLFRFHMQMVRLAHQHAAAPEIRRNKEDIRRDLRQRTAERRAEIAQRRHKKHTCKAARNHFHHAGENRKH